MEIIPIQQKTVITTGVQISLSKGEAATLAAVVGRIAGAGDVRDKMDKIYESIISAFEGDDEFFKKKNLAGDAITENMQLRQER